MDNIDTSDSSIISARDSDEESRILTFEDFSKDEDDITSCSSFSTSEESGKRDIEDEPKYSMILSSENFSDKEDDITSPSSLSDPEERRNRDTQEYFMFPLDLVEEEEFGQNNHDFEDNTDYTFNWREDMRNAGKGLSSFKTQANLQDIENIDNVEDEDEDEPIEDEPVYVTQLFMKNAWRPTLSPIPSMCEEEEPPTMDSGIKRKLLAIKNHIVCFFVRSTTLLQNCNCFVPPMEN